MVLDPVNIMLLNGFFLGLLILALVDMAMSGKHASRRKDR